MMRYLIGTCDEPGGGYEVLEFANLTPGGPAPA
jgi:hypothetical protein